jgi:TPR repeat protein
MLTADTIDRYRNNTVAFVLAAARSGDPDALYDAHIMYKVGYWVPVDLVRAYRYAERWTRLTAYPHSQELLDRLLQRMTPDERRRARAG